MLNISHSPIKYATWTVTDNTWFVGRNGMGKCAGVELLPCTHDVSKGVIISPLTSKGNVANCSIKIPFESLPQIIENLQTILAETQTSEVQK